MPRPRKPLELLHLTGGYRGDRHGRRQAAPKASAPIGDPPAHLAPDDAEAWREFVGNMPPSREGRRASPAVECGGCVPAIYNAHSMSK